MSRSDKAKKAPGYEYWGRRPHNKHGGIPGKVTKRKTTRTERQQSKVKEQQDEQ
jgi:hypothetical protein